VKTSAENIKTWLCQSVDKDYYETRFSLMQKAFDPAKAFAFANGSGYRFPDYPDLKAQYREIGAEPWILETQLDLLSEVMRSSPEPEFPDVDEYTGQVRQAFWKKRNKGYGRSKTDGLRSMGSQNQPEVRFPVRVPQARPHASSDMGQERSLLLRRENGLLHELHPPA
jgi:hypothetical protein